MNFILEIFVQVVILCVIYCSFDYWKCNSWEIREMNRKAQSRKKLDIDAKLDGVIFNVRHKRKCRRLMVLTFDEEA